MRKAVSINNKGMTLVEIVAAAAIMGIAFVALISLFTMSFSTAGASREKTDMIMIAQNLMEYSCKTEGFSVLGAQADGGQRDISEKMKDIYRDRYDAVRIAEYVPDTNGHLIKVVIRVRGKAMTDFNSGVSLVTLVSDV